MRVLYDRPVVCQRVLPSSLLLGLLSACASGPAIGAISELSAAAPADTLAAVAVTAELITRLSEDPRIIAPIEALAAAASALSPAGAGPVDLAREIERVAWLDVFVLEHAFALVVSAKKRFPARFLGWSIGATPGFRYRWSGDAVDRLLHWRGHGYDIALFHDAIVVAPTPVAGTGDGSALEEVVAALRTASNESSSVSGVRGQADLLIYLPSAAATIASLSDGDTADLMAASLPLGEFAAAVSRNRVSAVEREYAVEATLAITSPPARRYVPLVRLALLPFLIELDIPVTRMAGMRVDAASTGDIITLAGLLLSKKELTAILARAVAGLTPDG